MYVWNIKHVEILKEWKAKAFVHLWLQDRSCYYYTWIQNSLSYPVIIFSTIASATLFASNNAIAQYIIGTLTMLSSILTSLLRQVRPGELQQQHADVMRKYHFLITTIDACLSLTPNMRPSPEIFIEKIGFEIDNLITTQIDPPLYVIYQFEKVFGDLDSLLYGEDIMELVKMEVTNNRMLSKYRNENDNTNDTIANSGDLPNMKIPSPDNKKNYKMQRTPQTPQPPLQDDHPQIVIAPTSSSETQFTDINEYIRATPPKMSRPSGVFLMQAVDRGMADPRLEYQTSPVNTFNTSMINHLRQ